VNKILTHLTNLLQGKDFSPLFVVHTAYHQTFSPSCSPNIQFSHIKYG